jgi:DNA polymerase-1
MEATGVPVVRGAVDLGAERKETHRQWRGWPSRWTSLSRRVHPRWCQTAAVTGRISAQDPPLQSLPRSLRYSVAAGDGRMLVAADLSGADFRAACAMSGDSDLRRTFEEGEDPYIVIGVGAGREARGREREVGKQIALAALYGASPWTLAQDLQLTVAAVERALEHYRARFPRLWAWRDELLDRFNRDEELRNPFGRHLAPETRAQAVNHPCQSAVADIVKRAMIRLDQILPPGATMIAQVHDEILVECAEEDTEDVATMMTEEMGRSQPELPVPLAAKVGSGRTWAEAVQKQR